MSLERKEVAEIAVLARLALAPDEMAALATDLAAILEHFAVISQVDTTDVPAMTHAVVADMNLRADIVEPSLPASEALQGAPKREGDLFVVPAIIAGDA